MKLRAPELKEKNFDTVYFGGGTPSVIDAMSIVGCMNLIRSDFNLAKNAEVTIEINPGTVDEEKIALYKKAGINRFSIGLQSANDLILEDIGRIHTSDDFVKACLLLADANKSADIMIGLKNQRQEDIFHSIDLAVDCGVKHISMYALTPEDGTPMYSDYLNGELPDSDEVADQYEKAREYLKAKGFSRYEVSNFALPGYESRHNLNYWRRGEYIGFGVAASSFMNNRRFTNTRDLDEYMKYATEVGEVSLRTEPGVLTMYAVSEKENPCKVTILETYASREAYEKHIASEHFQKYKQGTLHMVKSLILSDQTPLNPANKLNNFIQ